MTAHNAETINEDDSYLKFCRYLEMSSGITLGDNKAYLVESRLRPIMRKYNTPGLGALLDLLRLKSIAMLESQIINAMTTNETSWFRDEYPFDYLKQTNLRAAIFRKTPLRILSAACSYGHEPYSISIVVEEFLEKNPRALAAGIEIIATDISMDVLEQAKSGKYSELDVNRGLSVERRRKYFDELGEGVQIKDRLKQRISFRKLNLVQDQLPLGGFDIIFCRNVLIYFSEKNKINIINKIVNSLVPGGFLFLGASEPLVNYSDKFNMCASQRGVVYQLA
jgi:chemotaxis protein methyltransferase CheR